MLFFKLFGVEIQSLRIGVLLFTPPMVIMIYSMGRKIMPAGFALLAALFMLSAPSMYYNRFYTFFVVLNLYFLINVLEKRNLASLFGLGTAIFLSALFKFEVTLFSILVSPGTLALLFSVKHWRGDFNFSPKQAASASPKPGKFYFLLPWPFYLRSIWERTVTLRKYLNWSWMRMKSGETRSRKFFLFSPFSKKLDTTRCLSGLCSTCPLLHTALWPSFSFTNSS